LDFLFFILPNDTSTNEPGLILSSFLNDLREEVKLIIFLLKKE